MADTQTTSARLAQPIRDAQRTAAEPSSLPLAA